MILTILAVMILATVALIIGGIKDDIDDDMWFGFAAITGLVSVVLVVVLGIMIGHSVDYSLADERIAIVQQKNEDVEKAIKSMVENYLKHEGKTYEKMTPSEAVAMAVAYPELSSNELVKEQIATYKSNREMILKYEQNKVDKKVVDWWIHF